jgi:signal transduction histidine kinase
VARNRARRWVQNFRLTMKLQSKFTLYNTLSKAVFILVFVLVMPLLVREISVLNTDTQLEEKKEQVMAIIESIGIESFIGEGSDGTYGSYNLLREEFISLEQTDTLPDLHTIENSPRLVEDEIVEYRVLTSSFQIDDKTYLLEVARSLSTIQEIENTLRRLALLILLIISLVTTVSDIAFTKILLKPLNAIVEKLKGTKDPTLFRFKPLNTNTTDFRYLDNTIHEMMNRLEEVFLKEREFISNVSHELLTPVSILQSKIENIIADENLPIEAETRILESQKTLSRLKNVIRALLLISKIENHQYLKQDNISVKELLDEVVEEIEDRLETKEIKLTKEHVEDYMILGCNKSLLHIVFYNLINNAIKYNHPGGTIRITGARLPLGYYLQIRDYGVGIAPENIPHIFKRFKRFHKSDEDSFGLGLPIVKTIADFHDIKIDVESELNSGTKINLTFSEG